MTVGVLPRRTIAFGDGVTALYPVTFPFFSVDVYVNDVLVPTNHYSIVRTTPTSLTGSVLFAPAYVPAGAPTPQKVLIVGSTPQSQQVDYVENGPFPAEVTEQIADRLTMIAQELDAILKRTVRVPITADEVPTFDPAVAAGKLLVGNPTSGLSGYDPPTAGLVGVSDSGVPYIAEGWTEPEAVSVTRETYLGDTFSAPAFMPGVNVPKTYVDAADNALDARLDVIEASPVGTNLAAHVANIANPHAVTKAQVGLGSVDNTSDIAKPVSTAQQAALDLKAPLASPALTGTPTAPTAAPGTNTTQIATTAHVKAAIDALIAGAPGALDTLNEIAAQLATDESAVAALTTAVGLKAPIASPTFTGTPTAPTASGATNSTQIATTAFVQALFAGKADLASPAFTGTPTAPTPLTSDNTTKLATTEYVNNKVASVSSGVTTFNGRSGSVSPASGDYAVSDITGLVAALLGKADDAATTSALAAKAPSASPALTGTPTAPTATPLTNTTQIASTAYADAAVAAGVATEAAARTAADALKANIASPTFTGTPAAPTATAGTNTTQIATTAYVKAAIDALIAGAPGALDTLNEIAAQLATDESAVAALTTVVSGKAPIASPSFTGIPVAPTASPGTNTSQLATTAYADAIAALKANLASPAFSGTPTAPTASPGTASTQIATTAYADAIAALKANLASPTFTGTPAAPTAAANTNSTQIATTAYADAIAALKASLAGAAFTGNITHPSTTGLGHFWKNAANNRIGIFTSGAESGSNTGSDLYIWHYDDAGASLGSSVTIQRSNKLWNFATTPYVGANALYHAGNPPPASGGDFVKLTSGSVSTGTSVDINLSSYTAYKVVQLVIHECVMAGASPTLRMAVSQNGGTSFDTMSSQQVDGATVTASTTNAYAQLLAVVAGEPLASNILIYDFAASGTKTRFTSHSCGTGTVVGGGKSNTAGTTNLIRFTQSTGSNFAKFSYTLYGLNP